MRRNWNSARRVRLPPRPPQPGPDEVTMMDGTFVNAEDYRIFCEVLGMGPYDELPKSQRDRVKEHDNRAMPYEWLMQRERLLR